MSLRVLPILAVALLAAAEPTAALELRWKLAKGQVLRYRMTTDQRTTLEIGGEPVETLQKHVIVWRLSVEEVDPKGTARVLCRYESVAVDMDQMMIGRIVWDSTKREDVPRAEDPAIKPFAQLVGQEFNFGMRADGTVTDVKGYEKVARALKKGLEDNAFAVAALDSGFGEETVRAALERTLAFLPEGAVEAGARWSRASEQAVPLLGRLRYAGEYALAAVEGPVARIEARVALSVVAPPRPEEAGELAKNLEVAWKSGKGEAVMLFDAGAGRLARSEAALEMATVAKVKPPVAPDDGPGAAASEVKVAQKVTVELLP